MKKNHLKLGNVILILVLAFISTGLQAQYGTGMRSVEGNRGPDNRRGDKRPFQGIPNLTPEQEEKIKDLRTSFHKDVNTYRYDINIKRAELQKYKSAENPDMALINKTIDEISGLATGLWKKNVAHEIAVRSLLTDEQKAVFDARHRNGRVSGRGEGAPGLL
jgi:Spy/CpxP family protein refolding chaperone